MRPSWGSPTAPIASISSAVNEIRFSHVTPSSHTTCEVDSWLKRAWDSPTGNTDAPSNPSSSIILTAHHVSLFDSPKGSIAWSSAKKNSRLWNMPLMATVPGFSHGVVTGSTMSA